MLCHMETACTGDPVPSLGEMGDSQEEVAKPEVKKILQGHRSGPTKRTAVFSAQL